MDDYVYIMKTKFKKFDNTKIPDVTEYVKDYISRFPETEILVGSDSQTERGFTTYCTVIVMYRPGKGGHCVYRKWKVKKVTVDSTRLLSEVWASVEISNMLKDSGIPIKYIDIDVNPDPKYKSYVVYAGARGLVEGMGYECRAKTFAPLATSVADWIVKGEK